MEEAANPGDLVDRLSPDAAGEALFFRRIFDAECAYVSESLRRLGVCARDVEDVALEVFVTVHRRLGDFDRSRPVRPWLFGIALRMAADYRRLARHRIERIALETREIEAHDASPRADDLLAAEDDRRLVYEALEAINLDRRAVFVMYELDGYTVPEIAVALQVPVNTASSRLRIARGEFEAAIKRVGARKCSTTGAARGNTMGFTGSPADSGGQPTAREDNR